MSSSTKPAGAGADVAGTGAVTWSTPGNIVSSNDQWATALGMTTTNTSHYLNATSFGFAIPEKSLITGITVNIEKSRPTGIGFGSVRDNIVRLLKGGSLVGDNKADTTTNWTTGTDSVKTYGSSTDLWGTTWTPADINNTNFGVAIAAKGGAAKPRMARVDYIEIVVTYFPITAQPANLGGGLAAG